VVKIKKDICFGKVATLLYQKNYPVFLVEPESLKKFENQLNDHYFVCKYKIWKRKDKYPTLELKRVVGKTGNVDIET
jgi:hypothetical protein